MLCKVTQDLHHQQSLVVAPHDFSSGHWACQGVDLLSRLPIPPGFQSPTPAGFLRPPRRHWDSKAGSADAQQPNLRSPKRHLFCWFVNYYHEDSMQGLMGSVIRTYKNSVRGLIGINYGNVDFCHFGLRLKISGPRSI